MQLERLERYFNDYTYVQKGHYPVTDMLVYWYMGETWTLTHKEEQIAISEGLLRTVEAKGFKLRQEEVKRLFELYDLLGKAARGGLPDEVVLQAEFTEIIEQHSLAHS